MRSARLDKPTLVYTDRTEPRTVLRLVDTPSTYRVDPDPFYIIEQVQVVLEFPREKQS